jgi:hypothetical protein
VSAKERSIVELTKLITAMREKGDVTALSRLVAEAKTEWLTKRKPGYSRVIYDLCSALNSKRTAESGIDELVSDLAISVIDAPGHEPPGAVARFLPFLLGDPEHASGRLQGDAWAKDRRVRAERWLKTWQSIRKQLAALPKSTGPFYINVSPPPETGLPSGVGPEAVKDPVLRKKFEQAIEENRRRAGAYSQKRALEDLDSSVIHRTKRYLIDAFSRSPLRTEELVELLEQYDIAEKTRAEILEEVRRRTAARGERDAQLSRRKPAPAAGKLQYSLNGVTYHDVPYPFYVPQETSITFKAPGKGGPWTWQGPAGARGTGDSIKIRFSALSTKETDLKTVTATGGDTITAHVVVYQLVPTMVPEDNFPGRALDRYGVCEFIDLSYETVPAGIRDDDLGGLRWVIASSDGDLYGGASGLGIYQCSDVAGTIALALQYVSGPFAGARARPK